MEGAPILGDTLYQRRVGRILGQTVPVDPGAASASNQHIPLALLNKLRLSPRDYQRLPLYMHVHGLLLPRLLSANRDLLVQCPLPAHFRTLLTDLDLHDCIE